MRLPRRIPWSSISELEQLCSWIYTEEVDPDSRLRAIHRLSAWRAITFLPHALESTLSLLVVLVQDDANQRSLYLRQAYAAALIRLVNGFVDPLQYGAYARPIASIAHQLGLPPWLVELRHASTHEELPSLELLREAANESMIWLLHNYFLPTLNPASVAPSQRNPLRPVAPLLRQYKTLKKLTIRDASLATKNKQAIASLTRDIERWISEAKVTANLATGDFDWKTGKVLDDVDANDQYRERWALEKLCDGLLEKGALIPLSKKKRIYPTDAFSPPTLSVQIWSPLLHQLHGFHPDLPHILCSCIVSYLTSNNPERRGDPSFTACLSRWAMWSVETWDSDDLNNLRRDMVVTLMQALNHGLSENDKPIFEARELLSKLCDGRQDWQVLSTLFLQSSGQSADPWTSQNIDVMDQRLSMLEAFGPTEKLVNGSENLSEVPPVIPGWRRLDEIAWKPCPIGMHCL